MKKRNLLLLLLILPVSLISLIDVKAVAFTLTCYDPLASEHIVQGQYVFSSKLIYNDGNDQFYDTVFYVDNVEKGQVEDGWYYGSGTAYETVIIDVSGYSVGLHNFTVKLKTSGSTVEEDTVNFYIDSVESSSYNPTIDYTTPATDYIFYNYTASGTSYSVVWDLDDPDGTVSSMGLYLDDVEQQTWSEPALSSYSKSVTIDSDGTKTIKVNCTDSEDHTVEEIIHVIALTGTAGYITITNPTNTKHSERISFTITSTDTDGLHNLSVLMDFAEVGAVSSDSSVVSSVCNLTYDAFVNVLSGYRAIGYSVDVTKIENWIRDNEIDDTGERYMEYLNENVVDNADYYNTVNSFEEDDMSLQGEPWEIDSTLFTKRNNFTITNPKAEAMGDIVVRVPITYDSDMQSDMDDITITNPAGAVYNYELTDVIASTSCTIWIRFATFGSGTTYDLCMYYGNSTSSSKEDVATTWGGYYQVYHLDDTTDDGSGNTLTNSGGSFVSGQVGNAVDFDGSTDFMSRTDTLTGGGDDTRTWLWWGNIDGSPTYPTMWDETNSGGTTSQARLGQEESGANKGWFIVTDGGGMDDYTSSGLYNLDEWYGHAITKNNNDIEYFLNGVSKATDTNGAIGGSTTNDLYIGKNGAGDASWWFDGTLDELFVYDGVFSDNEIYVMYWSLASDVASWVGEESAFSDWTVGEYFEWYDGGGAAGERRTSLGYFDIYDSGGSSFIRVPDNYHDADAEGDVWVKWQFQLPDTVSGYDDIAFAVMIAWDGYDYVKFDWDRATTTARFGGCNAGTAGTGSWQDDDTWSQTFTQGKWYVIEIRVDFDNDDGYCYVDEVLKHTTDFTGEDDFTVLRYSEMSVNQGSGISPNLRIDFVSSKADGGTYVEDDNGDYYNTSWWMSSNGWNYGKWSTDGVRDGSDVMVMRDVGAGGYCYAYVQDELLQLDEPKQHFAFSWEINISTSDISKIDYIGFSMLADTGYYYHMRLSGAGHIIAGVSIYPYTNYALMDGYTDMDISWFGGWITLNITIIPDCRVIYFVDDVIIRDSYLDDAYQDISDPNCGLFYLLQDSAAGEYGDMVIDYFNTTDYRDGRISSAGETYVLYYASICIYNGSRYFSRAFDDTVFAGYSGNGDWRIYDGLESFAIKARLRFNNEAPIPSQEYAQGMKVCANKNDTDDYWYAIRWVGSQGRVYFVVDNHAATAYNNLYSAGYLEVADCADGLWHDYEIRMVENAWVAGFYDDVLIANVTYADNPEWFMWNTSAYECGRVSFTGYNQKDGDHIGNSTVCEMDYWSEREWTYNWYTAHDDSWGWNSGNGAEEDRADGSIVFYDSVAGSNCYIKFTDGDTYAYTLGYPEVYWEVALTPNETTVHYDYINYYLRLGSNYFHMALFSNGTLSCGVTDGGATGTWYSLTQASVSFTQNQQYIFRIIVGSSWIAYQYSTGSGFTTVRNSTTDYSSYYGFPNYMVIVVDNAVGQTNGFLFVDYLRSGWDEWQISDTTTVGFADVDSTLPVSIDENYYVNFTSTEACRFWATITTTRNISYLTYQWIYSSSVNEEQTNNWDTPSVLWSSLVEGDIVYQFHIGDDTGSIIEFNRTFVKDITDPVIYLGIPYNASEHFLPDVPSLSYSVDWGTNEDDSGNIVRYRINYNSTNGFDISWVVGTTKPDRFPTCEQAIVNTYGDFYYQIIITDSAGNSAMSAVTYFTVYASQGMTFFVTSSYDGSSVRKDYYNVYIDGILYDYSFASITKNEFDLIFTDVFGNELCNIEDYVFSVSTSLSLPLRQITLENTRGVATEYEIIQNTGSGSLKGSIAKYGSVTVHLYDEFYTVLHAAYNPMKNINERWMVKEHVIETSPTSIRHLLDLDIWYIERVSISFNPLFWNVVAVTAAVGALIIVINIFFLRSMNKKNEERHKQALLAMKSEIRKSISLKGGAETSFIKYNSGEEHHY